MLTKRSHQLRRSPIEAFSSNFSNVLEETYGRTVKRVPPTLVTSEASTPVDRSSSRLSSESLELESELGLELELEIELGPDGELRLDFFGGGGFLSGFLDPD
ncbi:hypothetical protein PF003_g31044 [Phytophthora fragariae]|nr:hypothetical protein PF003_g31039 [Phytophthora fragariae]KAE8884900.1 hypothetical protein PF003_g31042 [Phytophthora fragariae]KAE8884905.1 hypothetical protein PF003_g31044 [Phytophthora fragariae]